MDDDLFTPRLSVTVDPEATFVTARAGPTGLVIAAARAGPPLAGTSSVTACPSVSAAAALELCGPSGTKAMGSFGLIALVVGLRSDSGNGRFGVEVCPILWPHMAVYVPWVDTVVTARAGPPSALGCGDLVPVKAGGLGREVTASVPGLKYPLFRFVTPKVASSVVIG